jgi:Arc/MetJ-type ribon-helix-helix transcriptional regulator
MRQRPSKRYKGNGIFVILPKATLREIDRLVNKGDYLNRTHFVRRAVERYIEQGKAEKIPENELGNAKHHGNGDDDAIDD